MINTNDLKDSRVQSDLCPVCNKDLKKDIVKLLEGGFLFLETCPSNPYHFRTWREPTMSEIDCQNQ